MHEENYRRVALLLKQFEFVQTRLEAYERVLDTPWKRLKALFRPRWAKRLVDNKQMDLLGKRREWMNKAQKMSTIITAGNGHG